MSQMVSKTIKLAMILFYRFDGMTLLNNRHKKASVRLALVIIALAV